jgi:Xaa-Pro aminopeptidase
MTSRLTKLKLLLSEKNVDASLISSVPSIIYLTDFTHFSTHEREAFLLITQNNNYIITDARYSHAVRNQIKNFTLLEIGHGKSLDMFLKEIVKKENIKTLGIETTDLTVHEFEKIKPYIKETKHFSLSPLRILKEKEEIEKIKKACEFGVQTFSNVLKNIKENMSEKELAFILESFIRQQGSEPSFSTIVAFEENAAIPHHKTGDRRLKTGDLVLLDFGVNYENYCSDMTRTVCFGKATDEKKKIHQTVLEAQEKAASFLNSQLSSIVSGAKAIHASELDEVARKHITDKGYPTIPHSLGHGIGLEVHEAPSLSPRSKDELKNGMVFSIEPGIYLNDKMGIRIEDLFAIEDRRLIQLTRSSPLLIEIN